MCTCEYISQLCDYYGIPDRQITAFDQINIKESLHAVLDRLDEAAGLDTKGFFQQPHAGAYTVGIRRRLHEQHIQKPCQTYFWLGAEGGACVPAIGRYSG